MGQRLWANHGFGLIIEDYDLAEKIAKMNSERNDEEDGEYETVDTYDYFFDLGNCLIMDEGTAGNFISLIDDAGKIREDYTVDFAVCMYSSKQSGILSSAYNSIDEIVEEFKNCLKFPEDFSIKEHLGYFSCVVWD